MTWRKEILSAVGGGGRRLPIVAGVLGCGLTLLTAGTVGAVAFIGPQISDIQPKHPTADVSQSNGTTVDLSARMQVVGGLADCLAGASCPGRDPASDATDWISPTSTVNGLTLTPTDAESWKQWGLAFTENGTLQADTANVTAGDASAQTVIVYTTSGTTRECTVSWAGDLLATWSCHAPTTSTTASPTP